MTSPKARFSVGIPATVTGSARIVHATAQSRYAAGLPGRDLENGPVEIRTPDPLDSSSGADWHIAGRVPC